MARQQSIYRLATLLLLAATLAVGGCGSKPPKPSTAAPTESNPGASTEGAKGSLATISVDGLTGLRLKAQQGVIRDPAWGPFGT